MKVAFVSLPVPGHLNPMTTLARELQSRSHDIIFISLPDTEPFVRAAGLPFLPCCEKELPAGSVHEVGHRMGKLQGEECLQIAVQVIAFETEAKLKHLPATFAEAGVDAAVLDSYSFYSELKPMSLGMPYVHVSNALHFDYSGYTPLCVYDWPHGTSPANRLGKSLCHSFETRLDHTNTEGVRLREFPLATTVSPYWPVSRWCWPDRDRFPMGAIDWRTSHLCSMGTIQTGLVDIFRAIVAAAAKHKDLQLVLSVGAYLDPEGVRHNFTENTKQRFVAGKILPVDKVELVRQSMLR